MERNRASLAKEGLGAAAISYDSVPILKNFAERRGIRYPLLSDPDSKIIRAFGLLNTQLKPDSPIYGVPRPGLLLVDDTGVVREMFFEDDYRERYTVAGVLASKFGFKSSAPVSQESTPHLRLEASASDSVARGGQRLTLTLDIELASGFHVYAPGVSSEYIPIKWDLELSEAWKPHDPHFPRPEIIKFAGEKVPVFQGKFRITRDVTLSSEKVLNKVAPNRELAIPGTLRYQACDDRQCFPPRNVPLHWSVRVEPHDSERVPAELRRLK